MIASAMVLAAGRGERLRPLTDVTPKPLLQVGGVSLLERHLRALSRAGVPAAVVNVSWLEEQFEPVIGNGAALGIQVIWSKERSAFGQALETAGGIATALPLLDEVFWVVSADVLLPDFPFDAQELQAFRESADLARLWLVSNPEHHPAGDFELHKDGRVRPHGPAALTWASVGLFRRSMFAQVPAGQPLPLRAVLKPAIENGAISGAMLSGRWLDVGNHERLQTARSWFV